nr:Ig-like domain-containing protein [Brevibacillus sp. SYP-B805]
MSWIPAVLSFLLLVTTLLPLGTGVVHAAGGISLIGISSSTTATNPYIYYSSTITIQGTYGLDINGDDLRYRVTTLSGSQPNDTSSIKPALDAGTRTFTFRDIQLIPGVNKISFYEKNGDTTTDLLSVYVQYNNTPLFSDLKLNSVFLESDPTIVEVTSSRNLTLALSGKAANADNVIVTNNTTGKTFSDDVNVSGSFSVDLETQIGLNQLDIHAYSQNKEVALLKRNVLVVPKSSTQGASDQFYDVTITEKTGGSSEPVTNIDKIPPASIDLIETSSADKDFELNGKLLIKVQPGATILDSDVKDTTTPDAPAVNPVNSDDTKVTGIAEAGSAVTVYKGSIAPSNQLGATTPAQNDGKYSVTIPKQPVGTTLLVTAKDAAGNVSAASAVTVTAGPDKTPPSILNVTTPITDTATTVTGATDPFATVTVKRGATVLGSAVAAANGVFSVTIPPQAVGTAISVTASDAAGNVTPATAVIITGTGSDTTAPDAPTVNAVDSDDTVVKGTAEAGTTVTVYKGSIAPGNVLGTTAIAQADGSYTVNIGAAQSAGTTLIVTAKDAANESSGTNVIVGVAVPSDTTAPSAPTVPAPFYNDQTTITGTAEVGATVTVRRGATVLGTAIADGATNYTVTIPPQSVGTKLSVTATDAAGNVSNGATVDVKSRDSFTVTLDRLDDSMAADVLPTSVTVKPIANSAIPSDYKLYSVKATVDDADPNLNSGGRYAIVVKYATQTLNTSTMTSIVTTSTVANYSYQFVYKKSNDPRFGAVTDVSSPTAALPIKTDGSTNIVSVLPAKVAIETFNMTSIPADYEVYYNNSLIPLKKGTDYNLTLTDDETVNVNLDADSTADSVALIEFLKLPTNETTVKVQFTNLTADGGTTNNPANDKEISFKLKPQVAPSLLFYYTSAGQEKVIDSTLEITDPNVSNLVIDNNKFKGKIYNYKLTSSNMKVTLNGSSVNYTLAADSDPKDNIVPFEIDKSQFMTGSAWNFKQGNNTLLFELTDDPNVKFTYSIIYNTEKTPKIQDVKLKVVQGNDDVELTKSSSDTAYQTSALFLSEFSFNVANVDPGATVTVRKDGNVIAKYSLTDASGDWDFLSNDSDYKKARDEAIKGNTSDLGPIFDNSTFSEAKNITNKFSFTADMDSKEYGEELVGELDQDMGLKSEELENRLKLFPLTLAKGGTTSYEIEIVQGSVATRQTISIAQTTQAWTVISPKKQDGAPYIMVNTNSVPIKIFAEKATKVMFGKTEAVAYNTTDPDFKYDEDTGKLVPETYYVFEANVALKPGLNKIKFTVVFGSNSYNDEIQIYNANSAVSGAESRDILGKKVSFSVFEKAFELKFPSGTVLLAPSNNRAGSEINPPATDIFTDVPLYFGIADRTNGRVTLDDDELKDDMEDILRISSEFNYASPLYYVDAGNSKPGSGEGDEDRQPGGRDPYFDGTVNNVRMEPFIKRWRDNLVPSKPGTVTIKYDPSIVNAANNILTVFYNNGDEWTNIGGVVNTSKKTITVPFKGFGYYMVMKQRETFSDVINHPFARDAIETLYAKGIMNDAPGDGFGSELKISRGEFATMIVKALDLPINAGPYNDSNEKDPVEPTFTDVRPSDDDWDYQYKYIETAARAGIIRGKETRAFFPDDPLTREEAAIIIARALNLKLSTPEAAQLALGKLYTDAQLTGYYAASSVLAVSKAKIMNGEANDPTAKKPTYRFNPKGDLTRAEMAVITIRIMQQLKKLPK